MVKKSPKSGDRLMLFYHGTARQTFSPNVLYTTAKSDLGTYRDANRIRSQRAKAKRDGASASAQGRAPKTGFLANHVNGANSPADVLRAAIKGIRDGQRSKNVETLYLYADLSNLQRAVILAEEAGHRDNAGADQAGTPQGQR